jgi:hypothetical protein
MVAGGTVPSSDLFLGGRDRLMDFYAIDDADVTHDAPVRHTVAE